MKRTSTFLALLFGAMLLFSPAGAQQKTMPMPENNGTEMKMDKVPPVLQKQAMLSQEAISFDKAKMKMLPKMNRVDGLKMSGEVENLSEDQQKEMVKSYMRAAFAPQAKSKAPKAGTTPPSSFIARMPEAATKTCYFSIANDVVDGPYLMGINNGNFYIYPMWGAWCGDHYEGLWGLVYNGANYYDDYYFYDYETDEVELISGFPQDANIINALWADYDPVADKIYLIAKDLGIYEITPNSNVFESRLVGTLTGVEPVAMAIDKTGKMYVIGGDGKLYSVNNETWVASEIGNTGITPTAYKQSAAFDGRSQKLYWVYDIADEKANGIAKVDVTTGQATTIEDDFYWTNTMACVFYVDENPAAVEDFALSYEGGKVKATFTVPELTLNYDAIEQLATAEIVKVTESANTPVWSKQNPTPGEEISTELENVGSNGETVTLAVRVTDENGVSSNWTIASVLLFNATLPYVNGFEDADQTLTNATIFAVDPTNKGDVGRVNTEKYEGSYSFQISGSLTAGDKRQMDLRGIPVEKGGGYKVSFYVKTDVEEDGIVFAFDGAAFRSYYAAYNDEWTLVELTYTAAATGQMSLTLQGYGIGSGTKFFIDNLKVEQTSSPAAPAAMTINDVVAAENGALQAIVNVTLPDKTMAEENLTKIDSIVFECVKPIGTSLYFDLAEKTTVKTGLTPGATTDVTIPVGEAGQYCLRALIYSGGEHHPEYATYSNAQGYYVQSPWIGSDMPASVKVTATPGTDGTVVLEWLAPTASHQGYIGTVTYTIKDAAGTQLYNGPNLTFTTAALALGMHTFTFEMTNGIETKTFKANTIAGIREGMIYSNVATSGTTETRVLNVSATATNSAFSQMLYPATGQAMYIDTLLLFTTAPETGEAAQDIKIYMGTTELTAFGGSAIAPAKDFVEKDQLTEVFAGTLRFKAGENTLKLPLKGFYYDGTQTLVISVVKPMQEPTTFAAAAYVAVSQGNRLKYRAVSTSIDFDTVKSYNDYTGTPNGYAVSMVATPGAELKTLKVTVDSVGLTPLEGAIVTIVNKGGKNMNTTIITGADGTVSFAYMPQGTYTVKAQKAAYIASEQEVTVGATSPVEITFSLIKAKEVKVSGSVQDKGGNKLADVTVKAAGLADFTATTDNEGAFELQGVYGPGEYTLSFEKAGMRALSVPFVLGETDTVLAEPFKMGYQIVDIPMASVAVEDGKAVVNWKKPSVSSMVSWTPTFTQIRRLTIDNETPFKYAQRFLPEDLAALKLGSGTKALRFGFVVGSETAQYSIVLAADTTHEIYRAEVPADKLKVGEWCDIEIPAQSAAIDVTKELWLIVEVSGKDQNYPCAATNVGTVDKKGNLMNYNNKWYPITELFTNGAGNVLVRLLVEDASTQVDAANGYRVYRGLLENEFEDYTLLTQQNVTATTYTDAAYSTLPFGQYKYAVVADYYDNDLASPAYTNTVNKDMEFTVTFKVTSNAGSAKGADVYMVDTAGTREYEAFVNDKDTAFMTKKVWRDVYYYEVSLDYHTTVLGEVNITGDTVIHVALEEIIVNPELTANVEGMNVVVNYGVNLHNWFDDVESYADFAISDVDPWILSEGSQKYGVKDCEWTNAGMPQSWIVMNPSKTKPALSWAPYSGEKYFLSMTNGEPGNNDYLVRPITQGGGLFTFYVRAVSASDPESFEVIYSTTTSSFSEFKTLPQGAISSFNSTSWARGRFSIPEDAKYIGIRCTSKDAFGLLLDDLSYITEDPANPTGYELYLDGAKVKDMQVDTLIYIFKNLAVGEHKVGVKAIYASGASELVEKTVKIAAEAKPIRLNAAVEERTVVLTWDIPEGFAPKSYKVFLGTEQKAENLTEKTYTFTDLQNGKYTAAVVAVYETGESEKATVEFTINSSVDVEDFDMATRTVVYPNPNDGMFYLKAADKGMVEVYTMNGQVVKRMMLPAEGVYSIDLQNRAKGMYIVRFITAESAAYFKVMVR